MNGEIPKLLSLYMAGQWLNLSGLPQHHPLRVRGSPAGAIKLEIKLAKTELEEAYLTHCIFMCPSVAIVALQM